MTKRIDSDALVLLNRMLGLGGGGSGATDLDDGVVSQTLDILSVVRRARTPARSLGWFFGQFRNIHAAGGALQSSINPFAVGALAHNAYPTSIRRDFDLWLISASVNRAAGAGALDGATLLNSAVAADHGWGVDDSGAGFGPGAGLLLLARWTGLDSSIAGQDAHGIAGDGSVLVQIGQRIPRNTVIRFNSDAAAAATFDCVVTLGVFPEGLGQDIAQ